MGVVDHLGPCLYLSGPLADKFFSPEARPDVLDLFHELTDIERDQLEEILERCAVIIRVANCTEPINDLDEFDNFCLETYIKILQLFPWISIPNTVHKGLAHLAQVMCANSGCGLGQLSEVI